MAGNDLRRRREPVPDALLAQSKAQGENMAISSRQKHPGEMSPDVQASPVVQTSGKRLIKQKTG